MAARDGGNNGERTHVQMEQLTEEWAVAARAVDDAIKAGPGPEVLGIDIQLNADANGREAAFITLTLEDNSSGKPFPWATLKPIHDRIWDFFADRGINRWPHVTFRLKSEQHEPEEDEPDSGKPA